MANIGKWNTPGTLATIMSTELNSLANGSQASSSSTFDNTGNLDMFVDIEVLLASLSPASGAYVSLYLLETVDGSNFPAQSAADLRLTTTQLLVTIPIGTTAGTAQRIVARNILLSPTKATVVFDNQTGVALNASGNTVKFLPYDYNLNG
jgi:hypothetical protein